MDTTIKCQLIFTDVEVHFSNENHVGIMTSISNYDNVINQVRDLCKKNNFTIYIGDDKYKLSTTYNVFILIALNNDPIPTLDKIIKPANLPDWKPHKNKFIQMVKASQNNPNKTINYTENWKFPNMQWSVKKMTC